MFLQIGKRQSRPKAILLTLGPGGACLRLNSFLFMVCRIWITSCFANPFEVSVVTDA